MNAIRNIQSEDKGSTSVIPVSAVMENSIEKKDVTVCGPFAVIFLTGPYSDTDPAKQK